jgi:TIR domain-containing protein
VGIIRKNYLSAITETKSGVKAFSEAVRDAKNDSRYSATTSAFLSHSHSDLEQAYVNQAIVFLRKAGVRIYIDSDDSSMPPFANGETATKLKQRIRLCDKFILLATVNSINSKWCNWELGLGDAHKYPEKIVLFPLAEDSGTWNGTEYLKIYARIEESDFVADYFKVIYPDGSSFSLMEWLKR